MSGIELFGFGLLALGWIVFQVLRRVFRPPRPLGTLSDEAPAGAAPTQAQTHPHAHADHEARAPEAPSPEALLDTGWGRAPAPPVPEVPAWQRAQALRAPPEAAQPLPQVRYETVRGPVPRAQQVALERRRHPHRPRLRTPYELHDAVVAATVVGPCRALEAWQPPESPR